MKIYHTLILILLPVTFIFCQQNINVEFVPTWNNTPISLPYSASDSTTIEIFKCYVSQFQFWKDSALVYQEENSYHLLDLENKRSLSFNILTNDSIDYDHFSFQLGIDSLTNVSGAMGGDLDPTKGMFWSWHTGYINFKLEGYHPSCPTRKNKFHYHLGGYMPPFTSVQDIKLASTNKDNIIINIALNDFIQTINLSENHSIMMPDATSTLLAKLAKTIFKISSEEP